MMYLSKGIPAKAPAGSNCGVSHCGRIYALGPQMAALWKKGRTAPMTVLSGQEYLIRQLAARDLVAVTDEAGPLAAYRLLSNCVPCPSEKAAADQLLSNHIRRVWTWLTKAGLRLTMCELVRLEEQHIQPTSMFLGPEGRQRLTEAIYLRDTIADGILETRMERSPARAATVDAVLQLLRRKRIFLN